LDEPGLDVALWDGKSSRVPSGHPMGHASGMLDLLLLGLMTLRAACRRRGDLVLENLLLRHQLVNLARPTRQRRRVRCGRLDKLLWGDCEVAVGWQPPSR
jgi:hypothetical protein